MSFGFAVESTPYCLRQHRAIWQEHSAKDFGSAERLKRAGILYVFPPFWPERMGQKIGRRPQTQLRGVALILPVEIPANAGVVFVGTGRRRVEEYRPKILPDVADGLDGGAEFVEDVVHDEHINLGIPRPHHLSGDLASANALGGRRTAAGFGH